MVESKTCRGLHHTRIEVNVWTCNVNDDGVGDSVNEGDVLAGDALDAAIDKAMLGEKK